MSIDILPGLYPFVLLNLVIKLCILLRYTNSFCFPALVSSNSSHRIWPQTITKCHVLQYTIETNWNMGATGGTVTAYFFQSTEFIRTSCCLIFSFLKCLAPLSAIFQLYQVRHGSWVYSYMCNQYISPLKLWVRTPFIARCTRYNLMWYILSVTCDRLMVFSVYSCSLH